MSWAAPTVNDVMSEFSATEKASLIGVQGASNLAAILGNVVSQWREYIRSGGYALDSDATKIPSGHFVYVIDIARWRLLIAAPSLKAMQTEDRKAANDAAVKYGEKIADQQVSVEPPSAGANSPGGNWNSERKVIGRMHPIPAPGTQFPTDPNQYANPNAPQDGTT